MTMVIDIFISCCVLFALVFILGGSIGLVRFPDVYCRMHAATKSVTLGIMFLMIAAFVYFLATGLGFNTQALLVLIFVVISAPIGAHMISKAAYHHGFALWGKSVVDELKDKCSYVQTKQDSDMDPAIWRIRPHKVEHHDSNFDAQHEKWNKNGKGDGGAGPSHTD